MNPHVNNPKMVPPDLVKHTLPVVFNQAGYDTMRTCKNGNSYDAANKLFQVRRDGTRRGGTDERGSAWHAQPVLDYLNERDEVVKQLSERFKAQPSEILERVIGLQEEVKLTSKALAVAHEDLALAKALALGIVIISLYQS